MSCQPAQGGDGPADQDARGDTETAPSRPVASEPAMMRPMGPRRGPSVLSAGLPEGERVRGESVVVVLAVSLSCGGIDRGSEAGHSPRQIDQDWVSP
jgi:hypothetical protein